MLVREGKFTVGMIWQIGAERDIAQRAVFVGQQVEIGGGGEDMSERLGETWEPFHIGNWPCCQCQLPPIVHSNNSTYLGSLKPSNFW